MNSIMIDILDSFELDRVIRRGVIVMLMMVVVLVDYLLDVISRIERCLLFPIVF